MLSIILTKISHCLILAMGLGAPYGVDVNAITGATLMVVIIL